MFTQTPTPEAVFPLSPQLVRLTDEEFLTLSNYVKDHYGINLTKKRGLIEGRLNQELRRRGFKTFSDYFKVLFADNTGNFSAKKPVAGKAVPLRGKDGVHFSPAGCKLLTDRIATGLPVAP